MKRNSRLALALHTLGHMAADPDRMRTSSEIASHAGTNPVVVRRVLGKLRKARLLDSEKGHAGGWRLARDPRSISLADVYLALDERLIAADEAGETSTCQIEHALHRRVSTVIESVEQSLIDQLRAMSITDVQDDEAGAGKSLEPGA